MWIYFNGTLKFIHISYHPLKSDKCWLPLSEDPKGVSFSALPLRLDVNNHERMLSQRLNSSLPVFTSELPIQCVVKCFHLDVRKHRGYFNHLLPPEIPPFPACHRVPV